MLVLIGQEANLLNIQDLLPVTQIKKCFQQYFSYGQTNLYGWHKMICFRRDKRSFWYIRKNGLDEREKGWFPGRNLCKLSIPYAVINFPARYTK